MTPATSPEHDAANARQSLVNTIAAIHPQLVGWRIADALRRNVPSQLKALRIPGAQFAWAIGDRPPRSWCAGDASRGRPLSAATRFRVASLSKPLAAMVTLRLVDLGLLSLDEPVRNLIGDDLPGVLPGVLDRVTPRLLLCHAAGFAERHAPHLVPDAGGTLEDAIHGRLGEQFIPSPEFEPGTATKYAGTNYVLLQRAIERRTGRGFGDLAAELVLKPAGLPSSSFEPHAAASLAGVEHDREGKPMPHQWTPCQASSGLTTTASDLVQFGREVLRSAGGRGGVLPQNLARLMLSPQPAVLPSSTFTLGFSIPPRQNTLCLSQGSVRPGLRGVLRLFPGANLVFAGLVNGETGDEVLRPLCGLCSDIASRIGPSALTPHRPTPQREAAPSSPPP